jgi:acetyltransferase-like isoleucine patch superfamily enzyme
MLIPFYRQFFYFIIPNLRFILNKQLACIRYPSCQQRMYLRGQGTVTIGGGCSFGFNLGGFNRFGSIEIQPRYKNSKIKMGSNISTNNNLFFCAANYIEIGDDTLIGQNVTIMDHEAHGIDPLHRHELGEIGEVILGKNVWIGNNVTILKNSTVGENSIIATGAVVCGNFPANVIIGGIPAKVIKEIK